MCGLPDHPTCLHFAPISLYLALLHVPLKHQVKLHDQVKLQVARRSETDLRSLVVGKVLIRLMSCRLDM